MIKAAIFDMDGTLIDSEPMWKEAEKQVFSAVGVEVTEVLSAQTASMTTRQVTEFWYRHFPWSGKSLEQVESEVVERVAYLIAEKGKPMDGVHEVLHLLHREGLKIGLATNAPSSLISVVLHKLGVSEYFHSVSSSDDEFKGKPDPAVYLTAAKKLAVNPIHCIAFEDSRSGVISAQKANMKTVVIPSSFDFEGNQYEAADIQLKTLFDFKISHLRA